MNRQVSVLLTSIFLTFIFILTKCSSGQKKEIEHPQTNDLSINSAKNQFFNSADNYDSLYKIFASSENYEILQSKESNIKMENDVNGQFLFVEDLKKYDMINYTSDAVFSVELYPNNGLIAKIRPLKPSGISELNKVIADDITRLKFDIKNIGTEPLAFNIHYTILLQKKHSSNEIKQTLHENAR